MGYTGRKMILLLKLGNPVKKSGNFKWTVSLGRYF
jgi:hypothetical protein